MVGLRVCQQSTRAWERPDARPSFDLLLPGHVSVRWFVACLRPTCDALSCDSWESYLAMLSKVGAWGSALEVSAAAVHYDRPIVVFQPSGVPEIYNAHGKGGAPVALWFRSKHYERLEGTFPPEILSQAANGPMQGNRGGGSESGATSRGATRLSALPSLLQFGRGRSSLVAISFYLLRLFP